MRLKRLVANQPGFHDVVFNDGFNLVLAERTKESTKKDSRNGLGKSTLIEILHFCLGRGIQKGQVPVVDDLNGWAFTLELELYGRDVALSRSVEGHKRIRVTGDFDAWPVTPAWDPESAGHFVSAAELRTVLAQELFGLSSDTSGPKYSPSLGSLLGYFSRRGRDSYTQAFEHHRKQLEWDKQVNVTYLLDLSWQDAAAWQLLKDEKKILDGLSRAAKEGVLPDYLGTEGALEAERVRLVGAVDEQQRRLVGYQVREDYREIQAEADRLTETLHRLANDNFSDQRSIGLYKATDEEERGSLADREQVEAMFNEANFHFPGSVARRLDEVAAFHQRVVSNRREHLDAEIRRLEREVADRDGLIAGVDAERAGLMDILRTHGALEEFQKLEARLSDVRGALRDVEARIGRLREFTEAKARYGDRVRELEARARVHYDELQEQRDRAIRAFNANTEALYKAPGRLIIDIGPSGYRFDVDIDRARSAGISNMKVLCFDLTLMQLWAKHAAAPGFLIHDSLLYDGVDERQKALGLDRAAREADRLGWQYICTFNSDEYPSDLLPEDSPARVAPIVTLTDSREDGMLLGRRFE